MTAKNYFAQALHLDERINSKVAQLDTLNDLATKCTSTLSGMPHNPGGSVSRMEDVIIKIIDLQESVNKDIDALVDLKAEMMLVIKQVQNLEFQTILEKRYLCGMKWESIASELGYGVRHILRIHDDALKKVRIPERCH